MKKKIIIFTALTLLAILGIYAMVHAEIYGSSLVGWWNMDNNQISGTALTDVSGNGNTGTLQNTPITGVAGKIGQSMIFNGTDSAAGTYVSIPSVASLQSFTALTICAWVNVTAYDATDGGTIIGKFTNATVGGALTDPYALWELFVNTTGDVSFGVSNGVAGNRSLVTSAIVIGTGKWHHTCGDWDGTTMRIYIDGKVDANTLARSTAVGSNTVVVRIGGIMAASFFDDFNGSLDDVRVYNRALSVAEIAQLYQSTSGNYSRFQPF